MRLTSDTINRNLSKDEATLDELLNPKKRINKKIVPTHHTRKRKVNNRKAQMMPNLNKPSGSSFNIPPACLGGKSSKVSKFQYYRHNGTKRDGKCDRV